MVRECSPLGKGAYSLVRGVKRRVREEVREGEGTELVVYGEAWWRCGVVEGGKLGCSGVSNARFVGLELCEGERDKCVHVFRRSSGGRRGKRWDSDGLLAGRKRALV
jgi:hypothetical protein